MTAYAAAAGRDLSEWTAAWLDRSGTDVLALDGSTVRAESPDDEAPRPHRINIASYSVDGDTLRQLGAVSTELTGTSTAVELPAGDLRLLNADDYTFAAVRPDAASLELMLDHLGDFPEALSRALVVGTITQLLLLGELAPRSGATAISRALHTERNPALVEPFLSVGYHVADRWARPTESAALRSALADAAAVLAGDPANRQPALRTLAASATTDEHWAVLEEAADASADSDLAWRMAIRHAELGKRDDDAVARLLEQDADPDAGVKRLKVLAASPDEEAKEAVWRAFFVDYSVPRQSRHPRARLDLLATGAVDCWRRTPTATWRSSARPEGRDAQPGRGDPGDVPARRRRHVVPAAAMAASDDETISLAARNQRGRSRSCWWTAPGPGALSSLRESTPRCRRRCRRAGAPARRSGSSSSRCRSMAAPMSPPKSGAAGVGRDRAPVRLRGRSRSDVDGADGPTRPRSGLTPEKTSPAASRIGAVGVVELVAVAVALLDPLRPVGLRHDAARRQDQPLEAEPMVPPRSPAPSTNCSAPRSWRSPAPATSGSNSVDAGAFDAGDVAGVLDDHALQAEAESERGDAVGRGRRCSAPSLPSRPRIPNPPGTRTASTSCRCLAAPCGRRTRRRRSSAGAPSPRGRSRRRAVPRRPRGRRPEGRCTCRQGDGDVLLRLVHPAQQVVRRRSSPRPERQVQAAYDVGVEAFAVQHLGMS